MDKDEIKAAIRYKFRTWRQWFYIFFPLYMISFIAGSLLFKFSYLNFLSPLFSTSLASYDKGFTAAFCPLLFSLFPFFVLFVAGPTIYAPTASFLTLALTGLYNGAHSSFVMREGRVALCLFEIIFSSAQAYILILWATMTTLSALRIFTDIKKSDAPELFSGSLFCAAGFRNTFNFRYVLSYIGFYIFMSLVTTALVALRAVAATLF